jgi:hypothetical protein
MPAIVPFIPLIIGGLGAAGAGVGAYEANNASIDQAASQKQSEAFQQQSNQQQQQAAANQANLTKQEAVMGAQGQSQAQTGGSLTDSGTAALTDLLAGYPGYQGGTSSISSGAGTSTGAGIGSSGVSDSSTTGSSAGTPDIAAILSALRNNSGGGKFGSSSPSTLSGGNWQTQLPAPQSTFELSNPVV